MRVLQVVSELKVGGAERIAATLAHAVVSAGGAAAVAGGPGPLALELDCARYNLPVLHRRPYLLPLGWSELRRALRAFAPDVVHCHNPGTATMAAVPTRRGRRPPAMVSVHGLAEHDYRAACRVLAWAGLPVVACGPGVAAALAGCGLAVRATIPNGVPPPPPAGDRRALLEGWGLPAGLALIVSVGRLEPQKNHALAIAAVSAVPRACLVIVGDGPLRSHLAGLAAASPAPVVLAGSRADARAIMGACDAVLIASDWEGLPLVALEALAARRPLVATSVRGTRELLTDDHDALLVPPGRTGPMAGALRRVLSDVDLARRLGDNGERLVAGYTERAMIRSYLDLYHAVASPA